MNTYNMKGHTHAGIYAHMDVNVGNDFTLKYTKIVCVCVITAYMHVRSYGCTAYGK